VTTELGGRRVLAVMSDYDGLIAALRARADELKITRAALDAAGALENGYSAKLLSSVPNRPTWSGVAYPRIRYLSPGAPRRGVRLSSRQYQATLHTGVVARLPHRYFLRRQHRPTVVCERRTEPAQERRRPFVASLDQ
jgi:hypothetical protein